MIGLLQTLLKLKRNQIILFLLASVIAPALFIITGFWILLYATMTVWLLILLAWIYTIGQTLHLRLPADQQMNLKFFKNGLTYAAGYLIAIFLLQLLHLKITNEYLDYSLLGMFVFCVLYSIYFISKSLVAIEEQRKVDYFDYRVTFYRFCAFFPFTAIPIHERVQNIILKEQEKKD